MLQDNPFASSRADDEGLPCRGGCPIIDDERALPFASTPRSTACSKSGNVNVCTMTGSGFWGGGP
jgi:hypothetical protein